MLAGGWHLNLAHNQAQFSSILKLSNQIAD
nr:MAG TPA: hypothetical protein [Caudoviricetes sp.]